MNLPEPILFPSYPTMGLAGPPKSKEERAVRARRFKAGLRRQSQLRRAAEVLPCLPGPGESLHTLLTGYFDFMLVLTCVIQARPSRCDVLRITTLSFSYRNVEELGKLLDSGHVGRIVLMTSDFMERGNPRIYQAATSELAEARGQTVASARCHAKVSTLAFEDGLRLVFEGSMNLRTNRNVEQMTCVNDAGLHDWHAGWIDQKVRDHVAQQTK